MRNESMIDKSEKRILIYSLIVFKTTYFMYHQSVLPHEVNTTNETSTEMIDCRQNLMISHYIFARKIYKKIQIVVKKFIKL